MKIRELLVEYDRGREQQRIGNKILAAAQREGVQDLDQIFVQLEKMDPTPNRQYMAWLATQYAREMFRLEDAPRVRQLLADFHKLKPRLEQKDINRYTLHELEDHIDQILNPELGKDITQASDYPIPQDARVLYNGPLGLLVVPETEEASCELGRGTKWCTAAKEDNMFDTYSEDGPLYIWRDRSGSRYQFHFESEQFMDAQDRPIDPKLLNFFRTEHVVLKRLFAKKEQEILEKNDPHQAYTYARGVIQGRWPEAEPVIAQDPAWAFEYARAVIQGRWPEAEPVIAQNPGHAFEYARNIIKGRWPEAEPVIAQDAYRAFAYARNIIKGRWPEAEPVIAQDPRWAFWYAREVIGGRWPEAEPAIAQDSHWASWYAQDVLRDRDPDSWGKRLKILKSKGKSK